MLKDLQLVASIHAPQSHMLGHMRLGHVTDQNGDFWNETLEDRSIEIYMEDVSLDLVSSTQH